MVALVYKVITYLYYLFIFLLLSFKKFRESRNMYNAIFIIFNNKLDLKINKE